MKPNYFFLFLSGCLIFTSVCSQPTITSQVTAGGNDNDWLTSMDLTTDGGWIVGGSSSSNKSGEKTQNSKGSDDYWIIKFDKTGKKQWDKTIGGNSLDDLYSVRQTKD